MPKHRGRTTFAGSGGLGLKGAPSGISIGAEHMGHLTELCGERLKVELPIRWIIEMDGMPQIVFPVFQGKTSLCLISVSVTLPGFISLFPTRLFATNWLFLEILTNLPRLQARQTAVVCYALVACLRIDSAYSNGTTGKFIFTE